MTERPLLMSGPMVQAILAGRKSQTRRVMTAQPVGQLYYRDDAPGIWYVDGDTAAAYPHARHSWRCPYGKPGDRLWIRETFALVKRNPGRAFVNSVKRAGTGGMAKYERDGWFVEYAADERLQPAPVWHPSIHMPRWACRLVLAISGVRVERLQDITRADAQAEGCAGWSTRDHHTMEWDGETPEEEYRTLWNALNGKRGYPWDANPWVWVLDFTVVTSSAT